MKESKDTLFEAPSKCEKKRDRKCMVKAIKKDLKAIRNAKEICLPMIAMRGTLDGFIAILNGRQS